MICIGVDPGASTGFAVWDCRDRKFHELLTVDFWKCFGKVAEWQGHCREAERRLVVYVEDPRGHKAIYTRNRNQGGRQALAKIAQNVGGVKKETELIISGLRRDGIVVVPIVPRQHKWDAKKFSAITGYEGRTNQHTRDSARLVFGMSPMAQAQYTKLKNECETPAE